MFSILETKKKTNRIPDKNHWTFFIGTYIGVKQIVVQNKPYYIDKMTQHIQSSLANGNNLR